MLSKACTAYFVRQSYSLIIVSISKHESRLDVNSQDWEKNPKQNSPWESTVHPEQDFLGGKKKKTLPKNQKYYLNVYFLCIMVMAVVWVAHFSRYEMLAFC